MLRHGTTRVLIADAVGLGKTIQAGLVVKELASAAAALRGLIVAPAGLLHQWEAELSIRFGLQPSIADAAWLAHAARSLPAGTNPWILPGLYLTSFDFLKRPEVLLGLDTTHWDIVVVDEAHAAAPGTARRAAVQAAAVRSTRLVVLTATPHAGDPEDFAALCRLGEADRAGACADPIVVFQRSRAHAAAGGARRTLLLPVRPTAAERRMQRLLEDYTGRVWREAPNGADTRARLAAIVLRKRGLSSAASLAASVRRRLALLDTAAAEPEAARFFQAPLPLDGPQADDLTPEDAPPDASMAAPGLRDRTREHRFLAAIAALADTASRAESKTRVLLRLLRRVRRPAIVFTEFRDTLERLARTVASAGHAVVALHGGLSRAERAAAEQAFARGDRVLLATDAASEGLNLQQGCHLVVHYELPWSPARLEQRTGRVDRIGQTRRVHEILLVADDTAERLVLEPLARRVRRGRAVAPFLSRLGDAMSESRVASVVMEGGAARDVAMEEAGPGASGHWVRAPATLTTEAEEEAGRLSRVREWAASLPAPRRQRPRNAPLLSTLGLRDSSRQRRTICVFSLGLRTADGTTVARQLTCVSAPEGSAGPAGTARAAREAACRFLAEHEHAVAAVALRQASAWIDRARADHLRAIARLARRELTLAAAVPVASALLQPGLFDGRALHEDAMRRQQEGSLRSAAAERLRRLRRARRLTTTCELEAILVAGGRGR